MNRLDVAIAIALTLATCEARAQPRDEGLDLARLCVHEAGWSSPDDCAAIYATAVHGGERTGMTWHRWLGVYARRFARREVRRQWVYRLDRAGTDPRAGVAWRAYLERWLAVLAAADAAIAAPPTCEATDWGSLADMRRRAAQGRRFRVVDCGQTRGVYSVRGER